MSATVDTLPPFRTVDPYADDDWIDARAPRASQTFVGVMCLVALATATPWLVALVAAQLAIGLTFGRRYCLPCLAYFELIQPRFGEGPIEDARPPRFANQIGLAVTATATLLFAAGVPAVAWALTAMVTALALLAATTGICVGCAIYRRIWGCETCA